MKVKTQTKKIGIDLIKSIVFTDSGLEIIVYDDFSTEVSIKNKLIEKNSKISTKIKYLSKEIEKIMNNLSIHQKTLKVLEKISSEKDFEKLFKKCGKEKKGRKP
jgi:hypothetical protein